MEKELNYPIKYAVQELTIKGGWSQNYEEITLGFIVSKCYVINQNIKYLPNGTFETIYKVVFPYKDIDSFRYSLSGHHHYNEEPSIPKYNYYGECTNANKVSETFDTYEEASLNAEIFNQEKRKKIYFCNIEAYKELVEKHNKDLKICKQFEQITLEKTTNIPITKDDISVKKLTRKKEQQ